MFENLDKEISIKIKGILKAKNIRAKSLTHWLNLSQSSVSDLLTGRSPWRIKYLIILAVQFGQSIEELIFDNPNYCKELHSEFLIEEKKFLRDAIANLPEGSDFKKKVQELFLKEELLVDDSVIKKGSDFRAVVADYNSNVKFKKSK